MDSCCFSVPKGLIRSGSDVEGNVQHGRHQRETVYWSFESFESSFAVDFQKSARCSLLGISPVSRLVCFGHGSQALPFVTFAADFILSLYNFVHLQVGRIDLSRLTRGQ